jgi:hypothetical protein
MAARYLEAPPPAEPAELEAPPPLERTPEPPPPLERDPRARRPRAEWLKAELAAERLRERIRRRREAKTGKDGEWTAEREATLLKHKAQSRTLIEGAVSRARERWRELAQHSETAVYAIGFKRLCDARGWTMADLAARRRLAALDFGLRAAHPVRWNPHRRPMLGKRRGLAPLSAAFESLRKDYAPCLRGVAQKFFCGLLAGPGDTKEDSQAIDRSTVREVMGDLQAFGCLHFYQPPAGAAEAFEVGDSGHACNRYWFHVKGNPKPALRCAWDPLTGEPLYLEVLELPWLGATPRSPDDDPGDA